MITNEKLIVREAEAAVDAWANEVEAASMELFDAFRDEKAGLRQRLAILRRSAAWQGHCDALHDRRLVLRLLSGEANDDDLRDLQARIRDREQAETIALEMLHAVYEMDGGRHDRTE